MLPIYKEKDKIYTIFNQFLTSLLLNNKSYLINKGIDLDLKSGLIEIKKSFIEHYDESVEKFDQKLKGQFRKCSDNAKILFIHLEYLWAFANDAISPETKRNYITKLLPNIDAQNINEFAYSKDSTTKTLGIANFGVYHNTNKYHELTAIIRLVQYLTNKENITDLKNLKKEIELFCLDAIYSGNNIKDKYKVTEQKCAIYNALLHLSNSKNHEMIISFRDKRAIINKLYHFVANSKELSDEEKIYAIKKELYNNYNDYSDRGYGKENNKYLWFFYGNQIKSELKIKGNDACDSKPSKKKAKLGSNATSENEYYVEFRTYIRKVKNLHNKLEKSFEKFLEEKDIRFDANEGYIDFSLTIDNEKYICELKPTQDVKDLKIALRTAIGQLIEYNYYYKKSKAKMIFVANHKPTPTQIGFLGKLGIRYLYQKEFGKFSGNALE